MKILLYKLKLALHLGLFLLSLAANVSNKTKPVVLGLFITGLLLFIGGITFVASLNQPKEIIAISTVVPNNKILYNIENLSQNELTEQIAFWEKVLVIQPHSRDVLLNLSHLYSALQLEAKAAEYKEKAVSIDPNNPLFE